MSTREKSQGALQDEVEPTAATDAADILDHDDQKLLLDDAMKAVTRKSDLQVRHLPPRRLTARCEHRVFHARRRTDVHRIKLAIQSGQALKRPHRKLESCLHPSGGTVGEHSLHEAPEDKHQVVWGLTCRVTRETHQ